MCLIDELTVKHCFRKYCVGESFYPWLKYVTTGNEIIKRATLTGFEKQKIAVMPQGQRCIPLDTESASFHNQHKLLNPGTFQVSEFCFNTDLNAPGVLVK